MNYFVGIGCAVFFGMLSTLMLRSILEYGITTAQSADQNSIVNNNEMEVRSVGSEVQSQITLAGYIKYLLLVIVSGIAVSVFLVWFYQQDLHYVILTTAIISVLWACGWYDLKYHLIPNRIIIFALILRAIIFILQIAFTPGEFKAILLSSGIAALALMTGAILCRFLSPNSVGYGDVKLLGIMGLYLGANHIWSPLFMTLILLFFTGVILLILKKADRKTEIPFAPFLLAGTVIAAILTGA